MPFMKVAKIADLEGVASKTVSVVGRKVGLFRNDDGTWSAMEVTCRHQNADMSGGRRTGSVIECPRHGWKYDLATGACLNEPWASLRTFETKVEDGWVKVLFGGDGA